MQSDVLVSIRNLVKHFDISGSWLEQLKLDGRRITRKKTVVRAVNGISIDIQERIRVRQIHPGPHGDGALPAGKR